MPKRINPIKKNIVKQSILQGKSFIQSLKDAGYTEATAHQSSSIPIVKHCIEEIAKDFDKAKITPEYVLAGLNKEAQEAKNSADRIKAYELLGKYLALFTDKQQVDANIITKQEQSIIDKYIHTNRLSTN